MKAGIVGVPLDDILETTKSVNGIEVLKQKGFYKLTGNIPGLAVYPQNVKIVGEVHFSGFANDPKNKISGLIANPKFPKPTRRVTHILDQREGLSKMQILENFKKIIGMMVSEVASEPVKFINLVPDPTVLLEQHENHEMVVSAEEMNDEDLNK